MEQMFHWIGYWMRTWLELSGICCVGMILVCKGTGTFLKMLAAGFGISVASIILDYLDMPCMPIVVFGFCMIIIRIILHVTLFEGLGSLMFGISVIFFMELVLKIAMKGKAVWELGNLDLDLMTVVVLLVILVLCGLMQSGRILEGKQDWLLSNGNNLRIVSVCIAMPIAFFSQWFLKESILFWDNYYGTLVLVLFYFVMSIVLVVSYLQSVRKESEIQTISQYGDYLGGITEKLHKREHEYKNQINTIIGIAEKGDSPEAQQIIAYAEKILADEQQRERTKSIISDNSIVAAYIYRMEKKAVENGILFDYYVVRPFPEYTIPEYELIEVLSNLISNGFEAVASLPEEKRRVSLYMGSERIEVTNDLGVSMEGRSTVCLTSPGYSTKGKGRGYGLANVTEILSHFGMKMEAFVKDDVISIVITKENEEVLQ